MIRIFVLAFFALNVFVSCASRVGNEAYQPTNAPEKIEFNRDRLDVYPDDVRKEPAAYIGVPVVWAGLIRSTDASEETAGDKIAADTIFEHHYFDGVQTNDGRNVKLFISPRGEGLFRARWHLDKTGVGATAVNAAEYAAPGKLAIVYGVPEKVGADGTVVLRYRYLRILDADQFNTNEFNYGRFGEPFCAIQGACKTNAPPMK